MVDFMKRMFCAICFLFIAPVFGIKCDFDAAGEKTSLEFFLKQGSMGDPYIYESPIHHPRLGYLIFYAEDGLGRVPGWENIGKYQEYVVVGIRSGDYTKNEHLLSQSPPASSINFSRVVFGDLLVSCSHK